MSDVNILHIAKGYILQVFELESEINVIFGIVQSVALSTHCVGTLSITGLSKAFVGNSEPLNSERKQVAGDNVIYSGDENSFIQLSQHCQKSIRILFEG